MVAAALAARAAAAPEGVPRVVPAALAVPGAVALAVPAGPEGSVAPVAALAARRLPRAVAVGSIARRWAPRRPRVRIAAAAAWDAFCPPCA